MVSSLDLLSKPWKGLLEPVAAVEEEVEEVGEEAPPPVVGEELEEGEEGDANELERTLFSYR